MAAYHPKKRLGQHFLLRITLQKRHTRVCQTSLSPLSKVASTGSVRSAFMMAMISTQSGQEMVVSGTVPNGSMLLSAGKGGTALPSRPYSQPQRVE